MLAIGRDTRKGYGRNLLGVYAAAELVSCAPQVRLLTRDIWLGAHFRQDYDSPDPFRGPERCLGPGPGRRASRSDLLHSRHRIFRSVCSGHVEVGKHCPARTNIGDKDGFDGSTIDGCVTEYSYGTSRSLGSVTEREAHTSARVCRRGLAQPKVP